MLNHPTVEALISLSLFSCLHSPMLEPTEAMTPTLWHPVCTTHTSICPYILEPGLWNLFKPPALGIIPCLSGPCGEIFKCPLPAWEHSLEAALRPICPASHAVSIALLSPPAVAQVFFARHSFLENCGRLSMHHFLFSQPPWPQKGQSPSPKGLEVNVEWLIVVSTSDI
jgi:hypothetical protein